MIKNLFITILAVIAFAIPSSAGPPSVQRQARDGDVSVDFGMMTVDFNTGNTAGIYNLGFSYPLFSLDWSNGADGFNAGLYVCDTPNGGGVSPLSGTTQCVSVSTLQVTDLTVESFKSKKRYIVIDIIDAGTGRLTIKGSWDQISDAATDGVDVLIGGENGVTDVANPNTDPIICPKTNAACLYLSSTTGWWAAVSSNGESATSWGSETEQVIYGYETRPAGAWDTHTTYDITSTCIRQRSQYYNTVIGACDADEMPFAWMRDVTITSISASAKSPQTNTDGCDFKLVEASTGTDVANAEILFPASDTTLAAGEVVSVTVGTKIDAGTRYALIFQDGSFCELGAPSCNCGSSSGDIWLEIRGIYH